MKTFLIKPENDEVKDLYKNHKTYHEGDSGLDLFITKDQIIPANSTVIVDLQISCQLNEVINLYGSKIREEMKYYSYNMYSRSSISKTPLRLANGVGLIDSGFIGSLKCALHNTSTTDFTIKKGERYVQLAYPDLSEVSFKLTNELRDTTRGNGGFGSTF
jgi:dUTP pyrophosphatase